MRREPLSPDLVRAAKASARQRIREDRQGAPAAVDELLAVVDERLYDSAFDVNELQRVYSPDAETFWAFRDHLGLTFYTYLNRRRLETARELVCACDARLIEIAEEMGFGDSDAFGQWFKRGWGRSPKKLRSASRRRSGSASSSGRGSAGGLSAETVYRALTGAAKPEDAAELIRVLLANCRPRDPVES